MDLYQGNWDGQTAGGYDGWMQAIKNKPKKARAVKMFTKSPDKIAHEIVNKRVMKHVDAGATVFIYDLIYVYINTHINIHICIHTHI
jgi:hypothetical protein